MIPRPVSVGTYGSPGPNTSERSRVAHGAFSAPQSDASPVSATSCRAGSPDAVAPHCAPDPASGSPRIPALPAPPTAAGVAVPAAAAAVDEAEADPPLLAPCRRHAFLRRQPLHHHHRVENLRDSRSVKCHYPVEKIVRNER